MGKPDNQNSNAQATETVETLGAKLKEAEEKLAAQIKVGEFATKTNLELTDKVKDLQNDLDAKIKSLNGLTNANAGLKERLDSLEAENVQLREMKSTTSKKIPAKFSWTEKFAQEQAEKKEA